MEQSLHLLGTTSPQHVQCVGRRGARPELLSPPPRPCLSLPAAYTPPAKFPSTHRTPSKLMSTTVQGRDNGQRLLQPCAREGGHKEVFSCHIPISPGLSTVRTHHHDKPGANVQAEQGKFPSRALRTARGHLCHCWSITEPPPLSHRLMELNAQEVPQQDRSCLRRQAPFSLGVCRRLVSALAPCPGALGQLPPQSLTQ